MEQFPYGHHSGGRYTYTRSASHCQCGVTVLLGGQVFLNGFVQLMLFRGKFLIVYTNYRVTIFLQNKPSESLKQVYY